MRMTGRERREQILGIAAEEFATAGLYGASTETIARRAGITQAYVLRLQGTAAAAAGDGEVRDAVRASFARLWQAVADTAQLDPVTIKSFLAFGMLLNTNAALDLSQVVEPWSQQARTRIKPGLFNHI